MVKLQDGSHAIAGELLAGAGEDDEGQSLKFEQISQSPPTWSAKSDMKDGSGRTRFYSFGLADTQVKLLVITKTKEELKAEAKAAETAKAEAKQAEEEKQKAKLKTEKAFKTVSPAADKQEKEIADYQRQVDKDKTTSTKTKGRY